MALGTLTTLYEFKGTPDAANPAANIIVDKSGDIFGGTQNGGGEGGGAVFELTPPAVGQSTWTESLAAQFSKKRSGTGLYGGVISGRHGDLYGVAGHYGAKSCGSVFEVRRTDTGFKQKTLWVFKGGPTDGCLPYSALNMDASGALYGISAFGGASNDGTVYKVTPPVSVGAPWTETVIWSFDGGVDGTGASDQMIFDASGNLYGVSYQGGPYDDGVVWELTPPGGGSTTWTRTVLWSFNGADGAEPTRGPLVMLPSGALIGTCHLGGAGGRGVVFELAPPANGQTAWTESTIWAFSGGSDGGNPTSGVARTKHGELIVPTDDDNGAIFELRPKAGTRSRWSKTLLWQFSGSDGSEPESPPMLLPNSVIAGTTNSGGLGYGTVWQLAW
jgi:uncharacterized repeat protein (TIGR03803 family)